MALTKKQLDEIKSLTITAENSLKEAELDLKQAERAGIDVKEHREAVNKLKEQIRKIKMVYF